jgi:sugar phosphate isomerase/epimerase
VKVGLFTDGLAHLSLSDALDWLERELPSVRDLELATGGYSPVPHYDENRHFADEIERRGFRLAALNVSGNPLENLAHDHSLRHTVQLAGDLGVDRVVCMSGGRAKLSGGAWFPGIEEDVERYWQERVLPYWTEIDALAAHHAGLRLCFELEPGAAVYNTSTFERVAAVGSNLGVNLDPSHFFWQSIDPLAVIARLGERVAFAHGKDTLIDAARLELDGALDRRAWHYTTVGDEHEAGWWRAFVAALQAAGYDRVVSIEYEDDLAQPEESILRAARVLEEALGRVSDRPEISV